MFLFAAIFISCHKTDYFNSPASQGDEVKGIIPDASTVDADTLIVDGYMSRYAFFPQDTLEFYINTKCVVRNLALHLYDAKGNIVAHIYLDSLIPQSIMNAEPYKNGYGYSFKSIWKPTVQLKSGFYLISKKIPFIIKNPAKSGDVVVLYPTNTENAYNQNGGGNLYMTNPTMVSYLRPVARLKYPAEFIKWNETQYNFDYLTDPDMDDYSNFQNYKLLVIIGHSEYWTRQARTNFDRFVAEGKNVLILSGNVMWWQVRYSADKSQIICYKDKSRDPETNPLLKTIEWNSTSLAMPIIPSIGADFDHGGYGRDVDKGWDGYKIMKPNSPLLAGTNLMYTNILSCQTTEYDGTLLIRLPGYYPRIDQAGLNFYKAELIGYDYGSRNGALTVGTFIVFKKTATTGTIVHTGSMNWCANTGFGGPDGAKIKLITVNAINILVQNKNAFSTP